MSMFSEEVSTTTRKSMAHLSAMKPEEFVNWLKTIKREARGILSNYKTSLKIDGLGYRFGKDENGRVFVEGSRTGAITDSGAFSHYAKTNNRPDSVIARAYHYDDMLEVFKRADCMKVLPNNTKVICEILYNPLAEEDSTGLTFVSVKYDKSKLGSLMTVIPIKIVNANDGKPRDDSDEILAKLYKQSNNEIKIVDPTLSMGSIDINAIIDTLETLDDSALVIIKSRKAIDKIVKENILNIINKAKEDFVAHLLKHPEIVDKFRLGPELEGITLDIPDKGTFKLIDPAFKLSKSFPKKGTTECELFLGRMQPPHLGHKKNIDRMKNPIIGVVRGEKSSQDKERNPIPLAYQLELIKKFAPNAKIKVFADGFLPFIISDMRGEGLEIVKIFAGTDRIKTYEQTVNVFNKKIPEDRQMDIEFVEIERSDADISATKIRSALKAGDRQTYENSVPKELWNEFEKLSKIVNESILSFKEWLYEDEVTNVTSNVAVVDKSLIDDDPDEDEILVKIGVKRKNANIIKRK